MLSAKQNLELTDVGPGSPAGKLFRSYWHPIALPAQLERRNPMPVEVLGEKLALFRSGDGVLGLTQDRCAHRGTSLSAGDADMKTGGRIDKCGLRCPYHGWLYDKAGQCQDQPGEPKGSTFYLRIKIKAYPVQEKYGFIWAYMGGVVGECEPPAIPPIDTIVRTDGYRVNTVGDWGCNYLQVIENLLDPLHASVLHKDTEFTGTKVEEIPQGVSASEQPLGLRMTSTRGDLVRQSEFMLPNGFRMALPFAKPSLQQMIWNVPVNQERTLSFHSWFLPFPADMKEEDKQASIDRLHKWLYSLSDDAPIFHLTKIGLQDKFACVSQGVVTDRTGEHLGESDVVISLMRRLMREAIKDTEEGRNPRGCLRQEPPEMLRFDHVV